MTDNLTLAYNGQDIRNRAEMLCLTDMWKAAGASRSQNPNNWIRFEGASFVEAVALAHNASLARIIETKKGKNGATFAHWQIAIAYAKYLNHDFHMWCNSVVRAHMEAKASNMVTLDDGSMELVRRSDGIARSTIHKVTNIERNIDVLSRALADLSERVTDLAISHDSRVAVLDMVSVRELLARAKAIQKGRRSLNRKIGYRLQKRALRSGEPGLCRVCPHSGVWLYQVDFANRFMRDEGDRLVAEHNASESGQAVLPFRVFDNPKGDKG